MVLGQQNAIESLLKSAAGERRHHAWIFCGPMGVGKCTTAVRFSALLLNMGGANPGSHPDHHLIRKEDVIWAQNPALQKRKQTNIPLDLLRERMIGGKTSDGKQHDAPVFKTPVLGKEKVFIIDEAELLDDSGQNALLKTLEEPPVRTTIILVTSRDDLLLPMVQSRCQTIRFSELDSRSMDEWVKAGQFKESVDVINWCLGFSCGSPGLFCEALEAGLPELANNVRDFLCFNKTDNYSVVSAELVRFVESNVARWIKENPHTSKEAANRRAVNLLLLLFGMHARQFVRGSDCALGLAVAGVLSDVELQLSTNISIKVLVESLATRWACLCVGDSVFI